MDFENLKYIFFRIASKFLPNFQLKVGFYKKNTFNSLHMKVPVIYDKFFKTKKRNQTILIWEEHKVLIKDSV